MADCKKEPQVKIRIKVQPSGLLNGRAWPEPGGEMEVPDVVGVDLCASGVAEPVAVRAAEKRPAADAKAEKRA